MPAPRPQTDKTLLDKLATARPDADPKTEKIQPHQQEAPKPVETVKKDILEGLMERKNKADGRTEATQSDNDNEGRHA